MTLSVYVLWFSSADVSNVVFVTPGPGNLSPRRPCRSPTQGSPLLPCSSRVPRPPSLGKVRTGVPGGTRSCLGACGGASPLVKLLSSLPTASPTCFSSTCSSDSGSFHVLQPLPLTPKDHRPLDAARFLNFHPLLLQVFPLPFSLSSPSHSRNTSFMTASTLTALLRPR